ncbi:MAG: FKBP-type peptidyl-prolyl cis-trans isomerase [Bacteroidales bacterium]
MRKIYSILLLIIAITSSTLTSCLDSEDPNAVYYEWKELNETFFNNKRDSIAFDNGYEEIEIPTNHGGGSILRKVIKSGEGSVSPIYTDKVKTHYTGTLYTGAQFDTSYSITSVNGVELTEEELYLYNTPLQFGVNEVIVGWTEALQLMHVGDKWEVIIPWGLGYGNSGSGTIPPFSTLIFEIELMEIVE